jgi:hypothetical protein
VIPGKHRKTTDPWQTAKRKRKRKETYLHCDHFPWQTARGQARPGSHGCAPPPRILPACKALLRGAHARAGACRCRCRCRCRCLRVCGLQCVWYISHRIASTHKARVYARSKHAVYVCLCVCVCLCVSVSVGVGVGVGVGGWVGGWVGGCECGCGCGWVGGWVGGWVWCVTHTNTHTHTHTHTHRRY